MLDADFEDFLTRIYRPLKTIENLTDVIYIQANEDWGFLSSETREQGEELLCWNYAINQIAKHLLMMRKECITQPQTFSAD